MRLTQPTDFDILDVLEKQGRNVAANIAIHLDRDRSYVNTRMPHLLDHRLVTKIGPAANSGLYELTDRGRAALANREVYDVVEPAEFRSLIEEESRER